MENNLFGNMLDIMVCQIEVYMHYHFLKCLFPFRKIRKELRAVVLLVCGLAIYGINRFENFWMNSFLIPVIFLSLALILYDISILKAMAYTIIVYVSFAGIEMVINSFYKIIVIITQIPIQNLYQSSYYYLIIFKSVINIIYIKVMMRYINKLTVNTKEFFSWYLLAVPITLWIVLICFLQVEAGHQLYLQILIFMGSLMLYLLNAIIFLILVKYSDSLIKKQKQQLAITKSVAEQHSYEHLKQVNEEYQQYIHDMNRYLRTMRGLAEQSRSEELLAICHQIGDREANIRKKNFSNNFILDEVIRERMRHAQELGIDFTVNIEPGVYVDFIDEIDLISMFGNLLDNSLEAAKNCEAGWIKLNIFMGTDHFLVVEAKNNYNHILARKGDKILTTKKDKHLHGFGIENVRQLAENYGGFLELEQESNVFIVTLTMAINAR